MTPGAMRSTGRRLRGRDGALVVERAAERVDDPAEQRLADRHLDHASGGLDRVAFLDALGVAQDDRADRLLLEVEGHAEDVAGELEQLGRQRVAEAVDLGDAVADLDHGADRAGLDAGVEAVDGGLDDAGDVVRTKGHVDLLEGARGELAPQPLEAAPDAPVDQAVAEPDHDAAEDARIDVGGQLDAAAAELFEAGGQGPDLVRAHRRRAGGGGVDDVVAQVVEPGELLRHARQEVDPAPPEEEHDRG